MSAWRNRRARAVMADRLRTDSEFEEFLLDHFEEEVRRVIPSSGADRLARENELIRKVGAEAILRALEGPRYALYWLRLGAAAIGLVAVGGLAVSRFPSPKPQPNIDMTAAADLDLSMSHLPPPMPAPPLAKRVKSPSVPKPVSLSGNAECNGPICRLLGISTQTLKRAQETQHRAICLDAEDVSSARMGIQAKCTIVSNGEPPECRRLDAMSDMPLNSPRWRLCEAE